jgi:hypothetical protein
MPTELFVNLSMTFVSMFITWLAGTFTMFVMFNDEFSLPEFVGFSYIVGSGITATLLYISSVTLGRFYPVMVYGFVFIAGTISVILLLKGRRFHVWKNILEIKSLKYYEYILILPVVFIIVVVILAGIAGGPNWDGLLTYGFIAKSLFLSNKIDMGFFTDVTRYGHVHLDYPLLLPLLEYWCYHFIGSDNYQLIQFISIGYYIALACIFYGSMSHTTTHSIVLLSLLILLFNPIMISNTVGGDTDIIVAVYLTGIVVVYSKLLSNPSLKMVLLVGMLTGFLANTKNEGFAFFVVFSFLLLFSRVITRKMWGYYLIPSAILGLPWFITKSMYGIKSDLFINVFQQIFKIIPLMKNRILVILNYYYHFFTGTFPLIRGTGLLWLIVLIGFMVMLSNKSVRSKHGICWVSLILQIFIYSLVYLITPHTVKWQLNFSVFRTMTQLAPPLLWLSITAFRSSIICNQRNAFTKIWKRVAV